MNDEPKKWKTYEEVATCLLNQMAEEFGLEKVEGKQKIKGLRSGTEWEIEAKGVAEGEDKFVIIECRRYPTRRLDQEGLAGLAYRILDTGASGGIVVTPLGLQEGAEKIAGREDILTVTLDENSSSTDYVMRFLEKIKVGMSGRLSFSRSLGIKLIHKNGTVEDLGRV